MNFKIGDWVRVNERSIHKIAKHNKSKECGKLLYVTWSGYNIYEDDLNVSLWKPRKDEWVIIPHQKNQVDCPIVSRYIEAKGINYAYCEPFVGDLPSFI